MLTFADTLNHTHICLVFIEVHNKHRWSVLSSWALNRGLPMIDPDVSEFIEKLLSRQDCDRKENTAINKRSCANAITELNRWHWKCATKGHSINVKRMRVVNVFEKEKLTRNLSIENRIAYANVLVFDSNEVIYTPSALISPEFWSFCPICIALVWSGCLLLHPNRRQKLNIKFSE